MHNRTSALLALAALGLPSQASAHTWFPSASLPSALTEAAAASDGGTTVYVVGGAVAGSGSSLVPTSAAWAYDVCTEQYTALPPLPSPARGASATWLDGVLYVAGGDGLGGALYAYDPNVGVWAVLGTAPTTGNGWETTLVGDQGTGLLHRMGGEGGATEHLMFDPTGGGWSTAGSLPVGLTGSRGFYDDSSGFIYLLAGWEGDPTTGSASGGAWSWDRSTGLWTTRSVLTGVDAVRFQFSGGWDAGETVFYGYGGSSTYLAGAGPYFDTLVAYGPGPDMWLDTTFNPDNPSGGRRGAAGAADGLGEVHVFGGEDGSGVSALHDVLGNGLFEDLDLDGFDVGCDGDCADGDPSAYPGAPEVCNFLDDDCDGAVDEDFELDGDFYSTCQGDCDDTDSSIHPNAVEFCDGVDQDCDGVADNDCIPPGDDDDSAGDDDDSAGDDDDSAGDDDDSTADDDDSTANDDDSTADDDDSTADDDDSTADDDDSTADDDDSTADDDDSTDDDDDSTADDDDGPSAGCDCGSEAPVSAAFLFLLAPLGFRRR